MCSRYKLNTTTKIATIKYSPVTKYVFFKRSILFTSNLADIIYVAAMSS
jgi:hypothetical protein